MNENKLAYNRDGVFTVTVKIEDEHKLVGREITDYLEKSLGNYLLERFGNVNGWSATGGGVWEVVVKGDESYTYCIKNKAGGIVLHDIQSYDIACETLKRYSKLDYHIEKMEE